MKQEWKPLLDNIFGAIVIGDISPENPELPLKRDVFRQAIALFKSTFQHNIFEDEYGIIYAFIQEQRISVFTSESIALMMDTNRDVILRAESIDFDSLITNIPNLKEKIADIDKFEIFREFVVDAVKNLSNRIVTLDEFKSACEVYKKLYIKDLTDKMISGMYLINEEERTFKTFYGRFKKYPGGIDGVKQYYRDMTEVIDKLLESTATEHSIVDEEWLQKELEDEGKPDDMKLIPFGLPEIDNYWHEFRRTNMLNVLGPPKGAKTRTCVYLVERFLSAGYNVAIWPLEGHKSEWEAMIQANVIKSRYGVNINSDKIMHKTYNEDERQLVISAKTELALGAERGRLSFISGGANCEDFTEQLKKHYSDINAYDVIVIDGIVLMGTLSRGKSKVERISEGFYNFQDFLKHGLARPPFGIVSSQLKQDVVDHLRKNPDETIDVTAGGESAETIRTPDYVLGVFSTKAERDAGLMNMYGVAARHCDCFPDFTAKCDLGCCWYESDPSLNARIR